MADPTGWGVWQAGGLSTVACAITADVEVVLGSNPRIIEGGIDSQTHLA